MCGNAGGLSASRAQECQTDDVIAVLAMKIVFRRILNLLLYLSFCVMLGTGLLMAYRLIPGSRTVTLPDCGHMLLAEQPDATLDALISFFAPVEAAG